MMQDAKTRILKPFNFNALTKHVPELERFDVKIDSIAFKHPIDSSNMHPKIWVELATIIETNYNKYDGFVILHGSDTMSYTASALSFMLENLAKPVILTGSQLPIGIIRTDGKENLITAIEIAAAKIKSKPIVPEVAIYFEYRLYRGNRTLKYNSAHFDAFKSPNYPSLAEAGVEIQYNNKYIQKSSTKKLVVHKQLENDIFILKLFPGISRKLTESILTNKDAKAIIIETFGSGNAPTDKWFIDALSNAIKSGKIILNITQCLEGEVIQGKYETSSMLQKIGVVGGGNMTSEAAVTKLMYLLGRHKNVSAINKELQKNLRGEMN